MQRKSVHSIRRGGGPATLAAMATAPSAFATYVNLAPRELERWLATEASAAAAGTADGAEVLRLLRTPAAARTPADHEAMARVVATIIAAREARPAGDVTDSPWRHALLNRGHDPLTWSPGPTPVMALANPARQAPDPRPGDPARRPDPASPARRPGPA